MYASPRNRPGLRHLAIAGALSAALLATGCASKPEAPTAALNSASVAIANAEKSNAGNYAGAELGEARQKLALAKTAVNSEKMVEAEHLARQAQVGAELAAARTEAAKADAVNKDMERGFEVLQQELKRAGDQQ